MEAKLIKTEEDYDAALLRIDELFDAQPGSKDFDEVELLMALVACMRKNITKLKRQIQLKPLNLEWNK